MNGLQFGAALRCIPQQTRMMSREGSILQSDPKQFAFAKVPRFKGEDFAGLVS